MSLRTLYDEASLWMTPSGYEDGKLFSELPTDGSGDFTFSRGSNLAATRVGPTGLIEKGRKNLLKQSNQFDTTWTGNSSNRSITSGFSGYDGTNNAWKLEAISDNNYSVVNQLVLSAGVETISVYAKAGTSNVFRMQITGGVNTSASYFDLSGSGSVGINFNNIDAKIESVGNGWFRCSVTGNKTTSSTCVIYVVDAEGSTNVTTGKNIYIQDAQLEAGLVATDYIETGASTAQAGILENEPRLDYSGGASCPALLLEPQRTNQVTYSEYFGASYWSKTNSAIINNAILSPEGVQNATELFDNATSGAHFVYKSAISASSNHMISFFAKANTLSQVFVNGGASLNAYVDLINGVKLSGAANTTIENYGNGWWRISIISDSNGVLIATSKNTNNNYSGSGESIYIYGVQSEEAASYPTSYIPTYGSSVTRSVEQAYTLEDSSLFDLQQGTLFLEMSALEDDGTDRKISISDGTNNNMVTIGFSRFTGNINGEVHSNGVLQTSGFAATGVTQTNNNKFALVWGNGEYRFYLNGVKTSESSISNSPIGMDILRFAQGNNSQRAYLNNKQLAIFLTALTDSECIELTINGLKEDLITAYKTRATTLEAGAGDRLDTYLQQLEDFIIV